MLAEKALFTAREAAVGFAIGAIVGIAIGVVFHFSNLLRRGFQPYVVGSQTVPILAIAPMVVIWLGGQGLPVWRGTLPSRARRGRYMLRIGSGSKRCALREAQVGEPMMGSGELSRMASGWRI